MFDFSTIASSDNILAIIVFLIFMIVLFIILLRVIVLLVSYIFSLNGHVKLLKGMQVGSTPVTITQDPSIKTSVTIQRSFNQKDGIEFTWSFWLFLTSIKSDQYQCIFTKGTQPQPMQIATVNCPGVYITNLGNLCVVVNTFAVPNVIIDIPDIPLENWFQIAITCQGRLINIYINGVIIQSKELVSPVYQNYGDVYIAPNDGFDGSVSNLWYWNKALTILEIQREYSRGPSTYTASMQLEKYKVAPGPNYLSINYYVQ
jgi:hypothetical protein